MTEQQSQTVGPGAEIKRYKLGNAIGEGGMGEVFEAVHLDLRKTVAIKLLSVELAANEEARARFVREGEAASRIRHPHVVDVTDVGVFAGRPYLVMERLVGRSLADDLVEKKRLSVEETLNILLPIAAAVEAGHDCGVVHRDLKPHNIFLDRAKSGRLIPKVLDFGVSKVSKASSNTALTGTGAFLGTVSYMSPEQARGSKDVDGHSDQYALGLVLYECLTGHRAFPGDNALSTLHDIVVGKFDRPRLHAPELPTELEQIVLKALSLSPADRFASLRALGRALLPFASDRTRAIWHDEFESEVCQDPALPSGSQTGSAPQPVALANAGADSSLQAGQTRLLSQGRSPSSGARLAPPTTTLSRASGALLPSAVDRRPHQRKMAWVAAAIGLASVVVVGVVINGQKELAPRAATALPPAVVVPPAPMRAEPAAPQQAGPAPLQAAPHDVPPTPVAPAPPGVHPRPSPRAKRRVASDTKPRPSPIAAPPVAEPPPAPPPEKRGTNNALIVR